MYEHYLGKDGFFHTSDRLVGAEEAAEGAKSLSFIEIIAGVSDMREATDAETRVLTHQLADEAFQIQQRPAAGPTSPRCWKTRCGTPSPPTTGSSPRHGWAWSGSRGDASARAPLISAVVRPPSPGRP